MYLALEVQERSNAHVLGQKLAAKVSKSHAIPPYVPGVNRPGWPLISALFLINRTHAYSGMINICLTLLYKTNRFHIAVHLFCNRLQKRSESGNISDTIGYHLMCNCSLTTCWHLLWSITEQMYCNMEFINLLVMYIRLRANVESKSGRIN